MQGDQGSKKRDKDKPAGSNKHVLNQQGDFINRRQARAGQGVAE
jgi:hypothetical protein